MDAARTGRVFGAAFALAAVAALAVLAAALIGYARLGTYLDHAEPSVTVLAWRLVRGEAVYAAFADPGYLHTAYGPVLFLANAAWMALVGPSILSSKLAGLVSAALAVLVFADHARRRHGMRAAVAGVAAFAGFLLIAAPISFWTRPEPVAILLVTAALSLAGRAEAGGRGLTVARVGVAVAIGLAVNLKAHAFVFFLPILVGYLARRWWLAWPAMAALAVAVFLLPFLLPPLSLATYLEGVLGLVASRAILPGVLYTASKFALLFVAPVLVLAPVLLARGGRLAAGDGAYAGALAACVVLLLYPASVAGASWYQMLPLFPVTVDVLLRLARGLDGAPAWRDAGVGVVLAALAVVAVTPERRLFRAFAANAEGAAVAAEAARVLADHPGRTVQMGSGADVQRAYRRTFVKPVLAFAGQPVTVDGYADMEAVFAGAPPPPGKLAHVNACATGLWLIPAGEAPFAMPSYYPGHPAVWPELAAAFAARHERVARLRFFDLWACRPGR